MTLLNRFMSMHIFCSSASKWLVEILVLLLGLTTPFDVCLCLFCCCCLVLFLSLGLTDVTSFGDGSFCMPHRFAFELALNSQSIGRCELQHCASWKKIPVCMHTDHYRSTHMYVYILYTHTYANQKLQPRHSLAKVTPMVGIRVGHQDPNGPCLADRSHRSNRSNSFLLLTQSGTWRHGKLPVDR